MSNDLAAKENNGANGRIKTKVSIRNHPVSSLPENIKNSYLKCITSVANADKNIDDLEYALLEDLSSSLKVPPANIDSFLGFFARKSDLSHLESDIVSIQQNNISHVCLADMFLMAYFDGHYCESTEQSRITEFCNYLDIPEKDSEILRKISHSVYNDNFDNALELIKKYDAEYPGIANWIKAFSGEAEQEAVSDKVIREKKTEERPSEAAGFVKETIESYQKETLSQLAKLETLLEKTG